jgi:hypothetical protein
MSRNPDSVRLIEEWLSDGPDVAPDRVLAGFSDRLVNSRQERGFMRTPPSWRTLPMMPRIAMLAAAAVIVIAVVIVSGGLLGRPARVGGPASTAQSAMPSGPSPSSSGSSGDPEAATTTGQVAYHASVEGNADIYLANGDGTDVIRLTTDPSAEMYPSWSPDGESIAFIRDGDVFVMAADGTAVTRVTSSPQEETAPSFAPDGTGLIFGRAFGDENWAIHRVDLDGANERQLYQEPTHLEAEALLITDDQLLVNRDLIGGGGLEIARVDLTTGVVTALTDYRDGEESHFALSHDASRIAYGSDGPDRGLLIMNADGTGNRLVTEEYFSGPIAWTADGLTLSFQNGNWISLIRLDGTGLTRLLEGSDPVWRPGT